jgi:hypothetical protein
MVRGGRCRRWEGQHLRRSVRLTQYGLVGISDSHGFQWRYCPSHSSARCSSAMGSLQGYQSGDSEIPGVALKAGIPALLILVAPTIPAIGFGLRARRLGITAGAIPALVGLVVGAMSMLLNALPLALGL